MWSWEFLGSVFQGTTLDFLLDAMKTQTGLPPLPILVFCVFFFGEDSAQPLLGCTRSHPDMVRAGQLLALSSPQVPEQGSACVGWRPPCWGCWQRPLLGQPQVEGEILWAQPLEPKHPQINPAERRKLMDKSKLMALGKSDRKAEFWGHPNPIQVQVLG